MTRCHIGHSVVMAVVAAGLLGCASGSVTGNVTPAGGAAAPLAMTWTSGLFGESGEMSAVLSDGERFAGKYQVMTPGLTRDKVEAEWVGDGPTASQEDISDTLWGAAKDPAFVQKYQNKAIATLHGDRGTTMLCRFNLMDGAAGMRGGGSGECQTSRGAKINAQF